MWNRHLLLLAAFTTGIMGTVIGMQVLSHPPGSAQEQSQDPQLEDLDQDVVALLELASSNPLVKQDALEYVDQFWQPAFAPMLIEMLSLVRDPRFIRDAIHLLEIKTGEEHGYDLDAWFQWLWSQPPLEHPDYAAFKSVFYGSLDPRFRDYFTNDRLRTIRLDEVRWGGVRQDGIPPLRSPKMISAEEADYLEEDNVVFGIAVNGDVRAYPKRILAWHEMFVDTVGGVPVAGVYCTLCGTMILYETEVNGVNHEFGTSGFLYRSNKLMYDQATQSLWMTLLGQPVIGPLVEEEITLNFGSVVTTTWGEWQRRHPDTLVLSLDTGHERDYGEGVAYQEYFATDELMFEVPELDNRLNNKSEVLGLLFPEYDSQPLAISAEYLSQHPLYQDQLGDLELVVLTDPSGANRVYESQGIQFATYDGDLTLEDSEGQTWKLSEDALTGPEDQKLQRLPAYRAFWFGWYSAYGQTRLVY
ncbi:MAG: DUF3179 domain-containing protein [Synechococcaceae cyanobacterium SM2_3_1]|nr:DUF3179 domain-containing protein [Synechococcaceae cyanobacterium SM2_3_1]